VHHAERHSCITGSKAIFTLYLAARPALSPFQRLPLQLKVTLRGVSKPPVWRRVLVHAGVLVEPGDRLRYIYDFGDEREHDVRLEKVLPPDADRRASAVPVCLAGKGACPPEDCGGAWGYASLKKTIADPSDEEHEERLEWLGLEDPSDYDPAAFDLASVNARLHGSV
jgi:hypothetical protein